MALTLHIITLLAALLLTAGSVFIYGRKPTLQSVFTGFVLATLLAFLLLACTVILSREGNSSVLPLLFWFCVWLIASLVPSAKKALGLCAVLLGFFLVLSFQHLYFATSAEFTDNPQERRRAIARHNRRAAQSGNPLLSDVKIAAQWYTWLTELYRVEPPAGRFPEWQAISRGTHVPTD